jgi:aminopeptidase
MDDPITERLADLAVNFGAEVQPDQILVVNAELGEERMARAVAAAAYRAGARHVEVAYTDAFARRARIEHGSDESIGYAPSWQIERIRRMGEERVAAITLDGSIDPAATDGLDPARLGADQSPVRQEYLRLVSERLINWCIVACPTAVWAAKVHPDMPADQALAELCSQVMHVCRLDEDDPVSAWNARMTRLSSIAERLSGRRFDAVAFSGPGTDLTVGLLPTSNWMAAKFTTAAGLEHHPNLPSEEVFTTPDPERVNGVVRSTKPLAIEGTTLEGLRVKFEGGRAVSIDADRGVEVLRARSERDAGGARLGEVALVDGEGRIGALETVFYTTLIDENAASHIALGNGFGFAVGDEADRARVNSSSIHIDFMIGGPEVDVDGVTESGDRVPVLRGGAWQI